MVGNLEKNAPEITLSEDFCNHALIPLEKLLTLS